MAGVKGKSGGARAGAGRKKKEVAVTGDTDPLVFLQRVWSGEIEATMAQVRAATAALPFIHKKKGEGKGKDEGDAPQTGKFGRRQPPRLAAAGGKKVH